MWDRLGDWLGQGWPMMLLGVVPLGAAAYLFGRGLRLRLWGVRAQGRLTGYQRQQVKTTRGKGLYFLPIVSFRSEDGQEHECRSIVGEPTKRWPVGTELTVWYLPKQPHRAEVSGCGRFWLLPLGLGVLGAIPVAIGVLMSMSG